MSDERTGVIYLATICDRDYIGMTVDFPRRKYEHLKATNNTHFHNAIRKYGADAIEWRVLEDDIPESRLPDREVLWIGFYDTYHNGYNMTEGGETSPMCVHEIAEGARMKMSQAARANVARNEHQAQQPEARAKNSATKLAMAARGELLFQQPEFIKWNSERQRALGAKGEHHSQQPENRERRSAILKEQADRGEHSSQCPKVRKKMSDSHLLRHSAERLAKWVDSDQQFMFDMTLESDNTEDNENE